MKMEGIHPLQPREVDTATLRGLLRVSTTDQRQRSSDDISMVLGRKPPPLQSSPAGGGGNTSDISDSLRIRHPILNKSQSDQRQTMSSQRWPVAEPPINRPHSKPATKPYSDVSATRLYIGNIPKDTTAHEIREYFSLAGSGRIIDVKIMNGFGFVEYEDPMDAREVVPAFHTSVFKGQRIVVNFARGSKKASKFPVKNKPLPGQMENCEICEKRFTVTPFSKTGSDGGLLCFKCSKESKDEQKKSEKAAKKKLSQERGRKRQTESERIIGDKPSDPPSTPLDGSWERVLSQNDIMKNFINIHYGTKVHGAELIYHDRVKHFYLVRALEGYFFFDTTLLHCRLVAKTWSRCLRNLRQQPRVFDGADMKLDPLILRTTSGSTPHGEHNPSSSGYPISRSGSSTRQAAHHYTISGDCTDVAAVARARLCALEGGPKRRREEINTGSSKRLKLPTANGLMMNRYDIDPTSSMYLSLSMGHGETKSFGY